MGIAPKKKEKRPRDPDATFLVSLPPELKRRAFRWKEKAGVSVAKMIQFSLVAYLDKFDGEQK
ncbi:MAG TPA: hypothetical protein ENH82_07695 [bacterium]|nr:hypothetical protein [bacterium]